MANDRESLGIIGALLLARIEPGVWAAGRRRAAGAPMAAGVLQYRRASMARAVSPGPPTPAWGTARSPAFVVVICAAASCRV